jgi:tripartite-type tricarboxylate transporter receptor subunit TctC
VASGAEPGGNTPGEFGAYINEEYERWSRLVRERGIKAN